MAIPRDLAQAVRSGNLFSNRGGSVLDAPEQDRAQRRAGTDGLKRKSAVTEIPLRRDTSYAETFSSDYTGALDRGFAGRAKRGGVRLSLRAGVVPKTVWGKIAAAGGLLMVGAGLIAAAVWARGFLLSDDHFRVLDSASIQIEGSNRLAPVQLLSIFGEDVDRNVFRIPLQNRRAELESLPWVAHATVMRLLPNRLRVELTERTPVAFVRTGTHIGLVDAAGVLFDFPDQQAGPGAHTEQAHFSFPVLTGISASDPLSTRAARMKLYMDFLAGLDSGGEGISKRVSEVDVSSPDDVKAIVPDANQLGNVLIHFGDDGFLKRYHEYQEHLAEWRMQCPRLASVDMRYEQQVVLEPCTPEADTSNAAAAAPEQAAHSTPEPSATPPARPRKNTAARPTRPHGHAGPRGASR